MEFVTSNEPLTPERALEVDDARSAWAQAEALLASLGYTVRAELHVDAGGILRPVMQLVKSEPGVAVLPPPATSLELPGGPALMPPSELPPYALPGDPALEG